MLSISPQKKYTLGADDGEAGTNTLPKAMCQNILMFKIIILIFLKILKNKSHGQKLELPY